MKFRSNCHCANEQMYHSLFLCFTLGLFLLDFSPVIFLLSQNRSEFPFSYFSWHSKCRPRTAWTTTSSSCCRITGSRRYIKWRIRNLYFAVKMSGVEFPIHSDQMFQNSSYRFTSFKNSYDCRGWRRTARRRSGTRWWRRCWKRWRVGCKDCRESFCCWTKRRLEWGREDWLSQRRQGSISLCLSSSSSISLSSVSRKKLTMSCARIHATLGSISIVNLPPKNLVRLTLEASNFSWFQASVSSQIEKKSPHFE